MPRRNVPQLVQHFELCGRRGHRDDVPQSHSGASSAEEEYMPDMMPVLPAGVDEEGGIIPWSSEDEDDNTFAQTFADRMARYRQALGQ